MFTVAVAGEAEEITDLGGGVPVCLCVDDKTRIDPSQLFCQAVPNFASDNMRIAAVQSGLKQHARVGGRMRPRATREQRDIARIRDSGRERQWGKDRSCITSTRADV